MEWEPSDLWFSISKEFGKYLKELNYTLLYYATKRHVFFKIVLDINKEKNMLER